MRGCVCLSGRGRAEQQGRGAAGRGRSGGRDGAGGGKGSFAESLGPWETQGGTRNAGASCQLRGPTRSYNSKPNPLLVWFRSVRTVLSLRHTHATDVQNMHVCLHVACTCMQGHMCTHT